MNLFTMNVAIDGATRARAQCARGFDAQDKCMASKTRGSVKNLRFCLLILLGLALANTACTNQSEVLMLQPPLKPGQVLDPESLYAKRWPGRPALVKLKENLILQIPPQYSKFWEQYHWLTKRDLMIRPPAALNGLPISELIGFDMHMPDYRGYTPDNYLQDFDQNRVEIVHIGAAPMSSMEPDASGNHPPNQFKRLSTGLAPFFDRERYDERYGMRCYARLSGDPERQYCYGRRDSNLEEYLLLELALPPHDPYIKYPQMRTKYFSSRYGGMEIAWRAHVSQWPHWREIDAQIWKFIDAWNVAPQASTAIPSK